MKRILSILILLVAVISLSAQSTTPRFGIVKSGDATGRNLTYGYVTQTDVAGFDSVKVVPHAYETIYNLTISTDSLRFGTPNVGQSYAGDVIKIIVQGTATGKKLTFGTTTKYVSQGTLTTTTKLKAVVTFVFDGAKWVEQYRLAQ